MTTAGLKIGDSIPAPLGVEAWGDDGDMPDGYFVGAMLGDGCMTNHGTPEFAQIDEPSRIEMLQFMADYSATSVVCLPNLRRTSGGLPILGSKRNPATNVLRHYGVRGLKASAKRFPNRHVP